MNGRRVRLTRIEEKERRRREADERNARHLVLLACGHRTALDPDVHTARCGAVR